MSNETQRAYLKILFTIMEKTPEGGANLGDLQRAYWEETDKWPSERTIYRHLEKLELFFDPLARGEDTDNDEKIDNEELPPPAMGILRKKRRGKTYYLFEGDLKVPPLDMNQAILAVLGLYPQHLHILKESFDVVTRHLLKDIFSGISMYTQVINHVQKNVHVAGPVPAEPEREAEIMQEVFRAIRLKKQVQMEYLRTYDGKVTSRVLEPYGFLCRHGNWYLAGRCLASAGMRLFNLSHVKEVSIIEDSHFSIPEGFSLERFYRHSWGVWTQEPAPSRENVVLHVSRGAAGRFRNVKFHPSQEIRELTDGEVEVSYRLGGAQEMIPWLLSWGTLVMVKQPEWLKQEVMESLRNIREEYEKG